ncbi:nitronate monooxygenase [uncultured Sphingomonas sp.]|uniref:nitronate monooxygenase n=1 Tax=uncultured Sphingomonas sp. TaxID=158754 RepID=UPI0035CC1CA2
MAGVSTPDLAAAVSNAGGLGSIAVGATDAGGARGRIEATRARMTRAFNVNLVVHGTAPTNPVRNQAWLDAFRPMFARYGADPPSALREIYKSFAADDEMLAMEMNGRLLPGSAEARRSVRSWVRRPRLLLPPQGGDPPCLYAMRSATMKFSIVEEKFSNNFGAHLCRSRGTSRVGATGTPFELRRL